MSLMVHSKLLTVLQAASESKSLVDNLSAPKAAFPLPRKDYLAVKLRKELARWRCYAYNFSGSTYSKLYSSSDVTYLVPRGGKKDGIICCHLMAFRCWLD